MGGARQEIAAGVGELRAEISGMGRELHRDQVESSRQLAARQAQLDTLLAAHRRTLDVTRAEVAKLRAGRDKAPPPVAVGAGPLRQPARCRRPATSERPGGSHGLATSRPGRPGGAR